MITGVQIREALRLLGWKRSILSNRAKLAGGTLVRVLASDGEAAITLETEKAIRAAFNSAGIEFGGATEDGPGVRLKKERV